MNKRSLPGIMNPDSVDWQCPRHAWATVASETRYPNISKLRYDFLNLPNIQRLFNQFVPDDIAIPKRTFFSQTYAACSLIRSFNIALLGETGLLNRRLSQFDDRAYDLGISIPVRYQGYGTLRRQAQQAIAQSPN